MGTQESKNKDIIIEGSPITVGGGGGIGDREVTEGNLICNFNEEHYQDPEPGNDKKKFFKHSGWRIQTFKTYAAGEIKDLSHLLPAEGKCEIEVHATGSRDDVTIESRESGGNMEFGVHMDTRRYKKNGNDHVADAPSYINKIELKGVDTWEFEESDDCAVGVDFVPPNGSVVFT
jgi:hypothetical protein